MTYASWEPRHRVTTVQPGKLDLFIVTLIDGQQASIDPVTEYDAALVNARAFHSKHPCQIKVLPMTGRELRNLLGVGLPQRPKPMDADVHQQIIETLRKVARDSNDADARADALQLLADLRELPA